MVWPLAVATLAGAGLSAWGQHRANKASAASAKEMMEFQQYNSDTSVQRAMKDMAAAGINPLLAGKYGASTPSGSSYSAQNELEGAPAAVGSAIQLKRMKAELANLEMQNGQIASQTAVNVASAKKLAAETELLDYSRMKEKAVKPFYDTAGRVVESAVSTARDIGNTVKDLPANVERRWKVASGKAKEFLKGVVKAPESQKRFRSGVSTAKQYERIVRKHHTPFGSSFDID